MDELLDRVVQTLIISQSCFVLGISAVIFKLYIHDRRIQHIAFVAASYILLTVLTASTIIEHLYSWASWRVIVALIAFGFGDYALLKILSFEILKNRQEEKP